MRSEASRLCEEKYAIVRLWTVVNAWVRSQPQSSRGRTTAGGDGIWVVYDGLVCKLCLDFL